MMLLPAGRPGGRKDGSMAELAEGCPPARVLPFVSTSCFVRPDMLRSLSFATCPHSLLTNMFTFTYWLNTGGSSDGLEGEGQVGGEVGCSLDPD